MDESLDVGAFDVEPGHAGYDASKVIAVQKLRIHTGVQTVTLTVSRLPKFAGVDPFNELISRNSEATITTVAAR
jgi:ABC-2 type transport system permease protein